MSKAFDNSQIINGAPAPIDADTVDGLQASSFASTSLSNVLDTDVLTKIKNVDGAGSGLDADLIRGLPADFTKSFTGNGYQKLPSGLIIQWGHTIVENVTFPIAFPNAVLNAMATKGVITNESDYHSAETRIDYMTLTGMRVVAFVRGFGGGHVTNQGVLWMVNWILNSNWTLRRQ